MSCHLSLGYGVKGKQKFLVSEFLVCCVAHGECGLGVLAWEMVASW